MNHACLQMLESQRVDSALTWQDAFFLDKKVKGFAGEILVAVAVVYVDDFLVTFSDHFNKGELLSLFSWGSQNTLTTDQPLEFKGKEIHLRYDNERQQYVLDLKQEKFIQAFKSGNIQYRSVAGSLQWVAGQTRPDVVATVSFHSKGGKATYADLAAMYEAVDHLRKTSDKGFTWTQLPLMPQLWSSPMLILLRPMRRTTHRNMDVSFCLQMRRRQMWPLLHVWWTGRAQGRAVFAEAPWQPKQAPQIHQWIGLASQTWCSPKSSREKPPSRSLSHCGCCQWRIASHYMIV